MKRAFLILTFVFAVASASGQTGQRYSWMDMGNGTAQPVPFSLLAVGAMNGPTGSALNITGDNSARVLNLTIPVKLSVYTNDAGFITSAQANTAYDASGAASTEQSRATAAENVLTTSVNGKEPTIAAGTTAQYWRGDKTWQTFPTIPVAQIQADWNQATTTGLDYIKNKPSIPSGQVQSDWNAVSAPAAILNKPTIPAASTVTVNAPLVNTGTSTAAILSHAASGITPGTYGGSGKELVATVDAYGHITALTTTAPSLSLLNQTFTTPAIGLLGTPTDVTYTVNGAVVGNGVTVNPRTANALGPLMYGFVSAANTVTVEVRPLVAVAAGSVQIDIHVLP